MAKQKPHVPETILGQILKLKVKERLTLIGMLPAQGNMVEQIFCEDIEEKVKISQTEIKKLNWRPQKDAKGNQIGWQWDDAVDTGKSIKFSEGEITFLKGLIDKKDKENSVTREMLPVCKAIKFGNKAENPPAEGEEDKGGDNTEVV